MSTDLRWIYSGPAESLVSRHRVLCNTYCLLNFHAADCRRRVAGRPVEAHILLRQSFAGLHRFYGCRLRLF